MDLTDKQENLIIKIIDTNTGANMEEQRQKVYAVIEEYLFEGDYQTDITLFATIEKANAFFEETVMREIETSWINNLDEADSEQIERGESYFHAWDSSNYDGTWIYIEEKEIQ